jgi:hypothetical protein
VAVAAWLLIAATNPGFLGRGRGRRNSPDDSRKALHILQEVFACIARASELIFPQQGGRAATPIDLQRSPLGLLIARLYRANHGRPRPVPRL